MGRRFGSSTAVLALVLAPLTLAGAMVTCSASVDLTDFATDAEAAAALQDAIDLSDLCMGEHVVEVDGDVTLTAPLVHRHAVPVVLRGVGEGRSVLSGGGASRILVVVPDGPSGAADLTLERVELRDGRADVELGPNDYVDGGAVWVPEGAGIVVTVRDAILADNVALEAGGAIAADDVALEDVAVVGNTAALGGALSVATLVARRVTFEGNGRPLASISAATVGATTVGTAEGGAVRAGLSVTLENVTFHANLAETGGAIWMDASAPVVDLGAPSAVVRGIDATFVTFVGNAASTGAHVAGVDTDGGAPVERVPATFRATVLLDAGVGSGCDGLDVSLASSLGNVTNDAGCPGASVEGTAADLLEGPDDHGAVGRTFLPVAPDVAPGVGADPVASASASASAPGAGAASADPASGAVALIDAVDCLVGSWPEEDQRGEERPQGEGCEVGAVEFVVEGGEVDEEEEKEREDDRSVRDDRRDGESPVPVAVPSGEGPVPGVARWAAVVGPVALVVLIARPRRRATM
jgi:hypothetical protein